MAGHFEKGAWIADPTQIIIHSQFDDSDFARQVDRIVGPLKIEPYPDPIPDPHFAIGGTDNKWYPVLDILEILIAKVMK